MAAPPLPARELFIDGRWVAPSTGRYLDVVNPATEEVIGRIPAAAEADVNAAVAAAAAAHKRGSWGKLSGAQRAVVLRAVAQKVRGCGAGGSRGGSDAVYIEHAPASARAVAPASAAGAHAAAPRCITQVRDAKPNLAKWETMDMGKPIDEAEWDLVRSLHACDLSRCVLLSCRMRPGQPRAICTAALTDASACAPLQADCTRPATHRLSSLC